MKINTRSQGYELTEELAAHVDRHVRFALTRFTSRVRHVHVQISDLNGPRGGVDKECQVRVQLTTSSFLVVKEVSDCPYAAVAAATTRIGHVVSRQVDRVKQARRGRERRTHQFAG